MYSDDCDCDQCQYERKTFVRLHRKTFDTILRQASIETEERFYKNSEVREAIDIVTKRILTLMGFDS